MREIIKQAFIAGAHWFENKSRWQGEDVLRGVAEDFANQPCPKCGGSGEADSGGVHPWGEGINIPCDCGSSPGVFSEDNSRRDFETMASKNYPGALSLGRHPVYGKYINANLEKRWKGWLLCDKFRNGIEE